MKEMMGCCCSRCLVILLLIVVSSSRSRGIALEATTFVKASGTHFLLGDHPYFVNGFNAYWLTYFAYEASTRDNVTNLLREAASMELSVGRTWAFNDGGYHSLQTSPGVYDEQALQGLDFVIAEAQNFGVKLLLSLSNNYNAYGGKAKYVEWARSAGYQIECEDDFFTHPITKAYYKSYVQKLLTRVNSITGITYRDDPTIFAWELMNEARCTRDASGNTLLEWIKEMSAFVKSIDSNHMLEIGLEGFYDASNAERGMLGSWASDLGTSFIRHNQVQYIDFATVHSYPDTWLPDESLEGRISFVVKWVRNHIEDGAVKLRKPVLFAEFGKLSKVEGERDKMFEAMYGAVFSSTGSISRSTEISSSTEMRRSSTEGSGGGGVDVDVVGAGAGAMVWQLVTKEVAVEINDGFEIVASLCPSTVSIISAQSHRVTLLNSGGV